MLKKGQTIELLIEKSAFPNKGTARAEDARVTVKNALPGQTVKAVVTKLHKGKAEARLLEVTKLSPLETRECDCPHFGICGSCLYRTLPYEEQCRLKGEQVKELLFPVSGTFPYEGVKPSPRENGYRNKMEFSFGDQEKGGPLTLGMHKRGSFYDVVDVPGCRIADEDFRTIRQAVKDYCVENGLPYYHKNHTGFLRHLLVRKAQATGEILVDLITSSQLPFPGWTADELTERLLALPLQGTIIGILHTTNDSLADAVINEGTRLCFGRDYLEERLLGLRFFITPFSFFQTNSGGAEVLYETVRDYVREAMQQMKETPSGPKAFTVFDLYSGTGTIAQMIAPAAEQVVGVEIVEEAVEAARENAVLNGLSNCRFLAGDVLKVLDEVEEKPHLIILDPPRDGIHPKALPKILAYRVPFLVYVSCKPTSLARDLPLILSAGYRVVKGCSVDMFPDTQGIETILLLALDPNSTSLEV